MEELIFVFSGLVSIIIVGFIIYNKFPTVFNGVNKIKSDFIEFESYINKKDITYVKKYKEIYKEIPYNGDLNYMFFVGEEFKLTDSKMDLIGAYLFDWYRKKLIVVDNSEKLVLIFAKTHDLKDEQELYDLFYELTDNGYIEVEKLYKSFEYNYNIFYEYIEKLLKKEREKYLEISNNNIHTYTEILLKEAVKIKGLKNYLKFLNDDNIRNDTLENCVAFSYLLGITYELLENIKKSNYKNIANDSIFYSYENIEELRKIITKIIVSIKTYKGNANILKEVEKNRIRR